MTVTSPAHVGSHLVVVAHTGLHSTHVTLQVVSNGKTSTHTVTTTAGGSLRWTSLPKYSGTVTLTFPGDLTHYAATKTMKYKAPSRTTVRLSTGYKHRSGVTYYHSVNSVAAVATVSPSALGRGVTTTFEAYRGGRWVKADSLKLYTDQHGRVGVYLKSARTHTLYRFTFTFSGDQWNTGSHVTSPRFEIA